MNTQEAVVALRQVRDYMDAHGEKLAKRIEEQPAGQYNPQLDATLRHWAHHSVRIEAAMVYVMGLLHGTHH